jgi:hypothetical protein
MSDNVINRRSAMALVGTALAAAAVVGSTAPATADQGNMEHAIDLCNKAIDALQNAPDNKGGHKHRAIQMLRTTIDEIQAGIDFADSH